MSIFGEFNEVAFGEALRQVRTAFGTPLRQVAEATGFNVGTLSRYETGLRRLDQPERRRLYLDYLRGSLAAPRFDWDAVDDELLDRLVGIVRELASLQEQVNALRITLQHASVMPSDPSLEILIHRGEELYQLSDQLRANYRKNLDTLETIQKLLPVHASVR